jgi:hypothetical protein
MRQITFCTLEDAIASVEDFADGMDCNVPIMAEDDGTFMFFGHGPKVARWICGDKEDDLAFYGINREPNPTSGYLVTIKT